MRRGVLKKLSLTGTAAPPRLERAEPRLLPAGGTAALRPVAETPGTGIGPARELGPGGAFTALEPIADRRPVTSAREPAALRQILLACLAVVVLGGLGGAALMLFAPHPGDTLPGPGPASGAPGATLPAAAAVVAPESHPAAPPAVAPAALPPQPALAALPVRPPAPAEPNDASPSGLQPAPPPAARASAAAASLPEKPAPPHPAATSRPGIAEAHPPPHPAAETRHAAHRHAAAHHLRLRAAAAAPSGEPPVDSAHPPRERHVAGRAAVAATPAGPLSGRPTASPAPRSGSSTVAGEASSFDDLLSHLTERSGPASRRSAERADGPALTPPAPGAPDPFAPHLPGGPPGQ